MAFPRHGNAQVLLSGSTNNSAAATITSYASIPASSSSSGLAVLKVPGQYNRATFYFAGTDAENETMALAMYGLVPVRSSSGSGFIAVPLASGTVTLGATTLGTAGAFIEDSDAYIADTITDTISDPRVVARTGGFANVTVDCTEFDAIIAEVTRSGKTAATMTVIAALSSAAWTLAEEPS